MFLARKITRAKWSPKPGFVAGEIPADTVTSDLRTQENSLSFWKCGNGTISEVDEAVLALAAGGGRVDKIEVVWLAEEDLRNDEQKYHETEGNTKVNELENQHVDMYLLDYVRLGKVANRIVSAIEDCRYRRLSKQQVLTLIAAAVRQKRVELADLKENVQEEVSKVL